MRIYLAGSEYRLVELVVNRTKARRFLFSYWSTDKKEMQEILRLKEEFPDLDLLLDSGAFSAFQLGGEVSLDEYVAFLKEYGEHFSAYITLDVIGNMTASWENQLKMEEAGLDPVYVYHWGEPFAMLDRIVEKYDYFMLGGAASGLGTPGALRNWLRDCFEHIPAGKKVHGLGMTGMDIMAAHPWYSVDGTRWLNSLRYGLIQTPDGGNAHANILGEDGAAIVDNTITTVNNILGQEAQLNALGAIIKEVRLPGLEP